MSVCALVCVQEHRSVRLDDRICQHPGDGAESPLSQVMAGDEVVAALYAREARILSCMDGGEGGGEEEGRKTSSLAAELEEVYAELAQTDAESLAARASQILYGLGFSQTMQTQPAAKLSGGRHLYPPCVSVCICVLVCGTRTKPWRDPMHAYTHMHACIWRRIDRATDACRLEDADSAGAGAMYEARCVAAR